MAPGNSIPGIVASTKSAVYDVTGSMRRSSRTHVWLAGALLVAGGCDLNPQPLPPESDRNGGGAEPSNPVVIPSGSDAGGFGAGSSSGPPGSGSGSGSSSGNSAGTPGEMAEAGTMTGSDASVPVTDAASDAGAAVDGGPDGSPTDASPEGAAGDAGCVRAWDCYASHPGRCGACDWPLNYPVCVEGQCACACDGADAAGE
jgi:hypothetical protein